MKIILFGPYGIDFLQNRGTAKKPISVEKTAKTMIRPLCRYHLGNQAFGAQWYIYIIYMYIYTVYMPVRSREYPCPERGGPERGGAE